MKVILLQDIENFGKKHEIKNVSDGHARNFLIPKGLVKVATEKNLEWLKKIKEEQGLKAEEDLKRVQVLVSKVDGLEVEISVKMGKKGKIFGSVGPLKISEKLKQMGFEIKKTQIELTEPIKEVGEWPVRINFGHGLEAEITVLIVEESEI